jgi:hypothetical protein
MAEERDTTRKTRTADAVRREEKSRGTVWYGMHGM